MIPMPCYSAQLAIGMVFNGIGNNFQKKRTTRYTNMACWAFYVESSFLASWCSASILASSKREHARWTHHLWSSACRAEGAPTDPAVWSRHKISLSFFRHHRVKKNNFFLPVGPRVGGEDFSDLCVDSQKTKTITLQLHTSDSMTKLNPSAKSTSRSPRERLYAMRSMTQIPGPRPVFSTIHSYLNYNNGRKMAALYSSDQYLDGGSSDSILQPIENKRQPHSKKLVAKYSDMAIQKDLNDFFKIRPVK